MAGGCGQQKTHGRFEPWVLVEVQFSFDKRQRRRQLRRRPAERLVEFVRTLRVENTARPQAGQASNLGRHSTFLALRYWVIIQRIIASFTSQGVVYCTRNCTERLIPPCPITGQNALGAAIGWRRAPE